MKNRKIFVLNPSQSRRLIAKGVANLPQIKDALKTGKIIVGRGSTNAYVLEELYKEAGIDTKINKADFVSGQIIPGNKFMKWWVNPRSDKKIKEILFDKGQKREIKDEADRIKELNKFKQGDIFIKGGNLIDINGIPGVLAAGLNGGTIGTSEGAIKMKGITVLCPIGLEKMIFGDLSELTPLMGQLNLDPSSEGLTAGLIPMPYATVVSEIEAMETLFNCDAYHVASGGVGGAEGSISLLVDTYEIEEEMNKINVFMDQIAEEPTYKPNLV